MKILTITINSVFILFILSLIIISFGPGVHIKDPLYFSIYTVVSVGTIIAAIYGTPSLLMKCINSVLLVLNMLLCALAIFSFLAALSLFSLSLLQALAALLAFLTPLISTLYLGTRLFKKDPAPTVTEYPNTE